MSYRVKEVFRSVQGEGINAGRAAVFVRFSGCNLWSGKEADRGKQGSCSSWCDTEFRGGRTYRTASSLMDAVFRAWAHDSAPLVIFTGGEPMLQIDAALQTECIHRGGEYWCETNGTIKKSEVFFVRRTVSPKAGTDFRLSGATEVKLVYPQPGLMPADVERTALAELGSVPRNLYLQPMDVRMPELAAEYAQRAAEFCSENPAWRLSMQLHKYAGVR